MTLANVITITRICLIPVFAIFTYYYSDSVQKGKPEIWDYFLSLLLFALIAITDGVDGYVARKLNQKTRLGSILDPMADKLLLLTALLLLCFNPGSVFPQIPIWFAMIVLSRDIILGMGVMVVSLMGKSLEIKPHWIGKTATLFQMVTIGMVLLQMPDSIWKIPLWLAGTLTGISGIIYIFQGCKSLGN